MVEAVWYKVAVTVSKRADVVAMCVVWWYGCCGGGTELMITSDSADGWGSLTTNDGRCGEDDRDSFVFV